MRRVTVIINASMRCIPIGSRHGFSRKQFVVSLFDIYIYILTKCPTRRFRHRNRLNAIDGLVNARYHDDDDYYDGYDDGDDDDNNNNC